MMSVGYGGGYVSVGTGKTPLIEEALLQENKTCKKSTRR